MFNFKSVFAIALLSSLTATAGADEAVIDTVDLHASITAELALTMEQMQQALTEDMNTILIAEREEEIKTTQVQLAE